MAVNTPFDANKKHCSHGATRRVIVALDLLLERDAVARAISLLRPDWDVSQLPPADVKEELLDHPLTIVICTRVTSAIEENAPVWVMLRAPDIGPSVIFRFGERQENANPELADIIDLIDHLED